MLPSHSHHSLRSENLRYEADMNKADPPEIAHPTPTAKSPQQETPRKARTTPFVQIPKPDEVPPDVPVDERQDMEEEEEEGIEAGITCTGSSCTKINPRENCTQKARWEPKVPPQNYPPKNNGLIRVINHTFPLIRPY